MYYYYEVELDEIDSKVAGIVEAMDYGAAANKIDEDYADNLEAILQLRRIEVCETVSWAFESEEELKVFRDIVVNKTLEY